MEEEERVFVNYLPIVHCCLLHARMCIARRTCVSGEFRCGSGECVRKLYVCDRVNDCSDTSDEVNCTYHIGNINKTIV